MEHRTWGAIILTGFVLAPSARGSASPEPVGCDTFPSVVYGATHDDLRCEAWVERYNDPVEDYDGPVRGNRAAATSPDGATLYTAATSAIDGTTDDLDALLIATDVATGEERWIARFPGEEPSRPRAQAYAMDVDPTGAAVYVLSTVSPLSGSQPESRLLAFDASSGDLAWTAQLIAPWGEPALIGSLQAAPDGRRVYVTGLTTFQEEGGKRFTYGVTAALEARDPAHLGEQVWVSPYLAPDGSFTRHVAVSPDGAWVFVGGSFLLPNGRRDGFTTLGYDAGTGERLWTAHEPGAFPNDLGIPAMAGMAVSPDGSRVFITGAEQLPEQGPSGFHVILVVAYDAATGERLWASRIGGPYPTGGDENRSGLFIEVGSPIAVAPDGSAVYVAGTLSDLGPQGAPLRYAIVTAALDAATGAERWRDEFDEGRPRRTFWPYLPSVVASADGVYVAATRSIEVVVPFVTAQYEDEYQTVALDAATGAREWVGRWGEGRSRTAGIAMTPDGSRIFVTGDSLELDERTEGSWDLVTVAYDTGATPPA